MYNKVKTYSKTRKTNKTKKEDGSAGLVIFRIASLNYFTLLLKTVWEQEAVKFIKWHSVKCVVIEK
jgi:hypothetical protein